MKGFFVTYPLHNMRDHSGIRKKIDAQIKAICDAGLNCKEICLRASKLGLPIPIIKKLQFLPFINIWPVWEYKPQFDTADFLYMRRPSAMSGAMIRVLRQIKRSNPKCMIVLEIPTFPYDQEMTGLRKLLLVKDKSNRKKLGGVIDYIALARLNDSSSKVFGVSTVTFRNGCDYNQIKLRDLVMSEDVVRFICVANFQPSHAYERLIVGLYRYKQSGGTRKIQIHMVGEGRESDRYKNMVNKLSLDNEVIFHGFLFGDALDAIYDHSDIAVSALGTYKISNNAISCIKNGEYMAKGLPVVLTDALDDIPEPCRPFCFRVPNDESAINFQDVLSAYDCLVHDITVETLPGKIRKISREYYDISKSVMPIVRGLKKQIVE